MSEEALREPFKNVIGDRRLKENIGDMVLAYRANQKLLDMKKDLNHLMIEFGYLLQDNNGDIVALVRVKTRGGLFKKEKVFYIALQQGKMMLLDNRMFGEELFRKTSADMLKMHNVDMEALNRKEYIMELY